jgi:hypothetical protein
MDLSKYNQKVIGWIGVDAGLVWIGDPCYIIHATPDGFHSEMGRTWSEFCDTISGKVYHSFPYKMGHEGIGVVTSTRHGDGMYPVIGLFEPGADTPSGILIDFDNITE